MYKYFQPNGIKLVIGSITNPAAVRVYNKVADKLPLGKKVQIENASYISLNFPVINNKRPRIEDAQISLKKTPEKNVEISLKMSPKVDLTFKAEVQQEDTKLTLGEIIVSGRGKTEIMGKDNPNYASAEREIEAALTPDNLNRLLKKLEHPIVRIKKALGFGK